MREKWKCEIRSRKSVTKLIVYMYHQKTNNLSTSPNGKKKINDDVTVKPIKSQNDIA